MRNTPNQSIVSFAFYLGQMAILCSFAHHQPVKCLIPKTIGNQILENMVNSCDFLKLLGLLARQNYWVILQNGWSTMPGIWSRNLSWPNTLWPGIAPTGALAIKFTVTVSMSTKASSSPHSWEKRGCVKGLEGSQNFFDWEDCGCSCFLCLGHVGSRVVGFIDRF